MGALKFTRTFEFLLSFIGVKPAGKIYVSKFEPSPASLNVNNGLEHPRLETHHLPFTWSLFLSHCLRQHKTGTNLKRRIKNRKLSRKKIEMKQGKFCNGTRLATKMVGIGECHELIY